ncbi:uncharacterized protein LOC116916222 isoform X1 [Daphnia magna]|uniref:Uncharacterized protein n=1 Tax=Daphnia magna TaxID=35525 RepID=A0A164KSW9_9CRUS|nr:uncharacterized protein LOC116916222 isoform X1 [Daphnia magna]KZS03506.1 Uncharacterized protein APZ42_033681 [Daphnia magna]
MWRLYSFVILLIASSICILPLPSRCNIIRSNKIHFPHKTHMATKSNATKIESSVDRIRELGNSLTVCPFAVKENKLDNRIPSMFYELECLHCNKCGKQGSKCTQLVTEMEVVFWKEDDSSWTEPETLIVKVGCSCSPVSKHTPAMIRP